MKKIGLIGFGSLGNQIKNLLIESGRSADSFVFFDDNIGSSKNCYPFKFYSKEEFSELNFIVCLGYKHLVLKENIINELIINNRSLLTFIHKTSYINPNVKIGKGVIIYPMCNIDFECIIGDGVLINNSVTVSHNCSISTCTYISPSVTLSGNITIDKCCFIGAGTIISNNIEIGENVIIGIGSVVSKNIPSNKSCIGNPLIFLNSKLNLK